MIDAQVALDKDNVTAEDIEKAYYALRAQMETMESVPGTEASDYYDIAVDKYEVEVGSFQPDAGGEGPAEFAQDAMLAPIGILHGAKMLCRMVLHGISSTLQRHKPSTVCVICPVPVVQMLTVS